MRLAMRITTLLLMVAFSAAWSCGSDRGGKASSERAESSSGAPAKAEAAPSAIRTGNLPDPCYLIPRAEVERIVGPVAGRPQHKEEGCLYSFPFDSSSPEWAAGRQRLLASGADSLALDLYFPRPSLFVQVDLTGRALTTPKDAPPVPDGWDAVGSRPFRSRFTGRTGHITISLENKALSIPPDTLVAMADRVRERIPDLPFAHPMAGRSGSTPPGRDPCSVLTRAEAETVLGQLAVDPYRSQEGSPLADPVGKSCAYFTPGHRVLILTPEWTHGEIVIKAERMVGGIVSQVADIFDVVADTLEGQWDDAVVGMSGDLIFLKGSDALSIGYSLSSTNAAGAVRLAVPALKRLGAAPEAATR